MEGLRLIANRSHPMNSSQSHNIGLGFIILGVGGLSVMAHKVLGWIGFEVMPRVVFAAVAGFFLLALIGLWAFATWLDKRERDRRWRNATISAAPIKNVCAWCDKVTDKADLTHEQGGAISHGICPACAKKYFPLQTR